MNDAPRFHLELAKRARKDLRKMSPEVRNRITVALRMLEAGQSNLDIRVITDRPPFLRQRVGDFRILLQPLTEPELQRLRLTRGHLSAPRGYLVARIVDRADFDRALETLELCEID